MQSWDEDGKNVNTEAVKNDGGTWVMEEGKGSWWRKKGNMWNMDRTRVLDDDIEERAWRQTQEYGGL